MSDTAGVEGDAVDGAAGGDTPAVPIHEALAQVMDEVQSISKAQRNTQQNYNFRGIDAVINAVGPAFRTRGIVCTPVHVELLADERYETKSKAQMRNVTVRIGWRFTGPAGDYMEAESIGEAADAGDKAVPKASSVAYRIVLLQALCIPTDDPDPDASSHERGEVRRQEGPPPVDVPRDWPTIEKLVRACDNPEEAWALFQSFGRAASHHLYGKPPMDLTERTEKATLVQKASGAAVWLAENAKNDGPFFFYDEPLQRRAWQHVLNTSDPLPIPDYKPPAPEPELEGEAALDEEARERAEADAEAETGYS